MALILTVYVYGFGSYFKGSPLYQDIDILLVHTSTDYSSCLEVIALKKDIAQEIGESEITILSKSAESEFNFIEKSQAILLSKFEDGNKARFFKELVSKVRAYKKT